jgi:MULE transposase domain
MELFAAVTDMLGEGLPLSYLFITTEANAAPQTKQKALIAWMEAIRSLGIEPQFTLSDKDQSEINALQEVWPDAKHQLCLWHILRALKWRLSQNQPPGPYNALEAHSKYLVIDPAFIPLGQMSAEEQVHTGDL